MFLACQASQTVIFGLGIAALIVVESYGLSLAFRLEAKRKNHQMDNKTDPDHPAGSLDRTWFMTRRVPTS